MDKVQEIMGLVDSLSGQCIMYGHASAFVNKEECAKQKALSIASRQAIEAALRELVEREPLSDDEAVKLYESWDYGLLDDEAYKVIRAVESAHGIGVK